MSKYLVIGDSGHAEKVAGKCAPDKSFFEWKFNQLVDTKMKKICADHGISYYQTNPNPADKNEIGLSKRDELANTYWKNQGKPKALFISYHANAYQSVFNDARCTETYVASNASQNSKNAAKYINDEIYNTFKQIDTNAKNRGVKINDFTVIYKSNMPSILVEYGFYTNKADLKILQSNVDDLVEATMKGICKYFGIKYIPNEIPTVEDKRVYKIVTGGFGSKENAEAKAEYLRKLTGWYLDIKKISEYDYCIETGGFTSEEKVNKKLNALQELTGWWAVYVLQ